MAGAAGPNTAEAGLVFAYDLGNTETSYIGEPTTNLVLDPDGNANIITTDVPFGTGVIGYAQYSSGYYVNPRSTTPTSATGNTFTYSVYMRSQTSPSSTYLMYVYTGTGPDGGWYYFGDGALTSDWKKYTYSRNDMTGTVTTVTVYRYNQQGIIDIAAPQIELKTHATQFIKGTRSVTQGLLNLTGNGVINIINASFDSNAQLVFDGTNDLIFTADSTYLNPGSSAFSIELLFNCSNASVGQGILYNKEDLYEAAIQNGVFQYAWQPHWNWDGDSTFPVSSNTWYHAVVTYDGSYQRMYKNGVEVYNRAQSGNIGTNSNVLSMGARGVDGSGGSGYNFFPGQIPVVKAYKAALTAAEVQQNYQALRYRFGI